jgi:type II secretory pathway pseudopilin PulG
MRTRRSHRNDGFSLMELLVTTVLATIVFGAMVPMFVSVQDQNAADTMRNVALQIARDKMEKIRLLDYDQVTVANLTAEGPPSGTGVFGTQWTAEAGTSATKDFTIAYTVTNIPIGSADGTEDHKEVQVSVTWTGAPYPRKTAVIQTDISRQFYGPAIVDLESPDADNSSPEQPQLTGGGPINFIATVSPSDLSTMTGTPPGQVVFVLTDSNGNTVATGTVASQLSPSYPTPGISGQYEWTWDSASVASGTYTVTVTATNSAGASGMAWSLDYNLVSTILPGPTNCQASAADGLATVTWNAVTGADHYQVWRATTSGAETLLADNLTAASYVDSGLTDGTTYYYEVVAVNGQGQSSAKSNEAFCAPLVGSDTTPPTAPANLAASNVANSSLTLTWTASVDNSPPAAPSGVKVYEIYRSLDGATWPGTPTGTVNGNPPANPPAATYPDGGLSPGTIYYYRVRAMDAAGNFSAFSPVVSATTSNVVITHRLTVTNSSNGNKTMSVTVASNTDGKYYDTSGGAHSSAVYSGISNKGTNYLTWTLPTGTYTVTASYNSSTKKQTAYLTVSDQALSFSF